MNRKKASLIIATLIVVLAAGCTSTPTVQDPPARPSASPAISSTATPAASRVPEALSDKVDAYLNERHFSGSVLLAKHGQVLVRKGYGLANHSEELPNDPSTIFRIGSVTKQFTALAIMQLQEQGKLDVQDVVHAYLPDYPHGDQITIHHLLTHTSGIPNFTAFSDFLSTMDQPVTVEQNMDKFKDMPLNAEPGGVFSYSNSGYIVLGAIIEQVSGQLYGEYLDEHIFKPLGMKDSGIRDGELTDPQYAEGYMGNQSGIPSLPIDMSVPYAAGAMHSTVDDLYKWLQALQTEQLIGKSSADVMFTPFKNGYAYGWGVLDADRQIYGHNGGINGFAAIVILGVQDHMTVIVLSNSEETAIDEIGNELGMMLARSSEGE